MSVTLLQAWTGWFNGQLGPDHLLWGVEILWWGRVGKVAQFVGALTVIVEIVGADRLRTFGNSLHGAVSGELLRQTLTGALALARDMFTFIVSSGEKEKAALNKALESPFLWLSAVLTIPVGLLAAYLSDDSAWWERLLWGFACGAASFTFVTPFLAAFLIAFLSAIAMAFDVLVVEPVAWCLERPALDRLTKLVGALLLVAGFHFDLLGS